MIKMLRKMKYMRSHIQELVGSKYNFQELLGSKCSNDEFIMQVAGLRIVVD